MRPLLLLSLILTLMTQTLTPITNNVQAADLPATSPHGILLDRVLPMAHCEDLDGSPEAGLSDAIRLRQVIHELKRGAQEPLGWPELEAWRRTDHTRTIGLGAVLAKADRLTESGQTVPATVFAFAPLQDDLYQGIDAAVVLDPGLLVLHQTEPVVQWQLDADDGLGWRHLEPGRPMPVSYERRGTKTLRLQALFADGTRLVARSVLNVKRLITPQPNTTWQVTASQSWQGQAGSGQAYLYLAPGHSTLTNPVIVVEGFDLDNSMDWPVLYEMLNQENLLEDLRTDGFDAVVLDFNEAIDPIQRNGLLLAELVQQVNAVLEPGRSLAVVGASMGGLVTRYGLAWLESQQINHQVRTFISFDSPQNGANIPLGLQHWLDFFKDESAEASYLLSRLDSPAARQMLLYHHTNPATEPPGPDPMFPSLRADLSALGDWPGQPRLAGLANGSGVGMDQGFNGGDQLIFYEYRSVLADIDGNVWSVPELQPQVIFDGMINLIWPLPDSYLTVAVDQAQPWDSAPGGFRPSLAQMDTTAVPYGDIVALHDSHCFIPTVSALGIDADAFFIPSATPDLLDLTPYDSIYYPQENQEHIHVSLDNKLWIMAEIQAGFSGVDDIPGPQSPELRLYPAVPNPFNPSTNISFSLPAAGRADVRIFDLKGRLVRTLASGRDFPAGRQNLNWSGRSDSGREVAGGIYLCRLKAGNSTRTMAVTLLK